jgi:hypothetical protein
MKNYCILIDPPYAVYYNDKLFDENDIYLNRDDILRPFINIKKFFNSLNISVHTVDKYFKNALNFKKYYYFSFGILNNYIELSQRKNVDLTAFVFLEPPLISKDIYNNLNNIIKYFSKVFLFNVIGDGYKITSANQAKLNLFYYPQAFKKVNINYWNNQRRSEIVMINGNKSKFFGKELYTKRIETLIELNKHFNADLYGTNWNKISWDSLSWSYLKNRNKIIDLYKGACKSKHEVLKNYKFSICFENFQMHGYVSEKIFDCFYVGTIPIYLGAPNINQLIPKETFIDFRLFSNYDHLIRELRSFDKYKLNIYKRNAKKFLTSNKNLKFYNSLINIVKKSIDVIKK